MAKLLTILNVLIIPKSYNKPYSDVLHHSEIDCKCSRNSCHYTLASERALEGFHTIRIAFGRPLYTNSFFRCQAHNHDVGGVDQSSHTTGNSFDISTKRFSKEEKEHLIALADATCDFVKVYDTFIHCQFNE